MRLTLRILWNLAKAGTPPMEVVKLMRERRKYLAEAREGGFIQ